MQTGRCLLKIIGTLTQTVDETAIGFGYEVFTNARFRLLYVYYITAVLLQALRDHVIPSASDAFIEENTIEP
jgi:hypothetical protein